MQYKGNKKYENYKTWDPSGTFRNFQVLSLHSRPAPSLFLHPLSRLSPSPFFTSARARTLFEI